MKKPIITTLALIASISLVTIHHAYTVAQPKQEPTESVPSAISTERVVATLNGLIAKNSAFLVKIGHHELPLKVKIWQRKGLLKLPLTISWAMFKRDVQQFDVDLHSLLEKDEKGVYYHIESLAKDTALYSALAAMNKGFPKAPAKETELALKIGKQPKLGLLKILNLYALQFYQNKLLEKIKEFFKGFEERAKGLRTAAEQAQKTAEQQMPTSSFDEFDYTTYPDTDWASYDTTSQEYDFETEAEPTAAEYTAEEIELPETEFDINSIDWGF